MTIIVWLVIGLVAGALARLIVPGRDPMGLLATLVLGLVGSFVGALLASMLFGDTDGVGLFGATVGAVIVLVLWNVFTRSRRRGLGGFRRRVIN
jgi:uncharacterized membrane protein YeaQ/YmgE (transglycosylase-associated protein family)